MTKIEKDALAAQALMLSGQDGDPVYVACRKVYMGILSEPTILDEITNRRAVADALFTLLSFKVITDLDTKQQITNIAYLLYSIEINETNRPELYRNRLMLLYDNSDAFFYTVFSVTVPDQGIWSISGIDGVMNQMEVRCSLRKMIYHDLKIIEKFLPNVQVITKIKNDLVDYFNANGGIKDSFEKEAKELHSKVSSALKEKMLDEADLDF